LVGYGAIIISGGPESVYDPKAPQLDKEARTASIDRLSCCGNRAPDRYSN
jgi:hypothetical protein